MNDFGEPNGLMRSLKSASNYECNFHKQNSCGESLRLLKDEQKGSHFWNSCMNNCNYKIEKRKFMDSKESLTNYSYLLAEMRYSKKLKPRELLILDEAHNCENELSKFIEILISEKFARDILKLMWPTTDDSTRIVEWIKNVYIPALSVQLTKIHSMISQMNLSNKIQEFTSISNQIDMLKKHKDKIEKFLEMWSEDNWVLNIIEPYNDRSARKFEFKPVDVGPYANELLFSMGDKILLMSATIVNKDVFCKSLGIKEEDVAFLSIDSPFPIDNRPVYYTPVGNLSQGTLDSTLPNVVEMVKLLLDQHKGEKGIIHTHTFKIANYIKEHLKSRRILIHDSLNRDEIIAKHISSPKDTVLLSPSLSEGIDLKDDLSRFQIICKIPYPYLGDKLVKKRMTKDTQWYAYQTAKTIVQSAGRSIRNEKDHAVTYILDNNWERFFRQNSDMLPDSFKKALKK
jgi:Rad3-related DNA helicase